MLYIETKDAAMRFSTIVVAIVTVAFALVGLPAHASGPGPANAPTNLAQNTPKFRDSINGRPLEDAPVSTARTPGVAPADRAGASGSAGVSGGPVDSTPFSGSPNPERGEGGQADRADPSDGTVSSLPNLGH